MSQVTESARKSHGLRRTFLTAAMAVFAAWAGVEAVHAPRSTAAAPAKATRQACGHFKGGGS